MRSRAQPWVRQQRRLRTWRGRPAGARRAGAARCARCRARWAPRSRSPASRAAAPRCRSRARGACTAAAAPAGPAAGRGTGLGFRVFHHPLQRLRPGPSRHPSRILAWVGICRHGPYQTLSSLSKCWGSVGCFFVCPVLTAAASCNRHHACFGSISRTDVDTGA